MDELHRPCWGNDVDVAGTGLWAGRAQQSMACGRGPNIHQSTIVAGKKRTYVPVTKATKKTEAGRASTVNLDGKVRPVKPGTHQ